MKKSNKKRVVTAFDNITSFICVIAVCYILWEIFSIFSKKATILEGIISIAVCLIIIIGFTSIAQLYDRNEELAKQLNELKKQSNKEED